jgi:hypothetical protein
MAITAKQNSKSGWSCLYPEGKTRDSHKEHAMNEDDEGMVNGWMDSDAARSRNQRLARTKKTRKSESSWEAVGNFLPEATTVIGWLPE